MSAVETHRPETEDAVAEIVRTLAAAGTPIEVRGSGSKRGFGRPMQAGATLETTALTGITLYEPSEMVIAARAGTPLSEIEAALDKEGQMLAFEPMDYGPLFGTPSGQTTIGAVAACNLSGPRRIMTGAARDALIGVRFVNGRGDAVKSGGRVMKNVTGYDLVKLQAGAHGTLGVLTEVTFKVLPKPEDTRTLVFEGLSDGDAREAMSEALGSPYEISGAAHLPAANGAPARTLLRLENFAQALNYRIGELTRDLKRFGKPGIVDAAASADQWQAIRDAVPLAEPADRAVWRISTAPTRGPDVVAALQGALDLRWFYDWGGGLIWLSTPAVGDAGATAIRDALGTGGHATLVRAPDAIRATAAVFQPLADPVMAINRGIKDKFDPDGVLNPGRMYAGV